MSIVTMDLNNDSNYRVLNPEYYDNSNSLMGLIFSNLVNNQSHKEQIIREKSPNTDKLAFALLNTEILNVFEKYVEIGLNLKYKNKSFLNSLDEYNTVHFENDNGFNKILLKKLYNISNKVEKKIE